MRKLSAPDCCVVVPISHGYAAALATEHPDVGCDPR